MSTKDIEESSGDKKTKASDEQREETGEEQENDRADEDKRSGDHEHKSPSGDFTLSDEGREEVHQMAEAYEDKPTVVMPGTHGTITGTAVNHWLDDEGNPKYGDPEEHPFAKDGDEGDGSEETSEETKDASDDSDKAPDEDPEDTPDEEPTNTPKRVD